MPAIAGNTEDLNFSAISLASDELVFYEYRSTMFHIFTIELVASLMPHDPINISLGVIAAAFTHSQIMCPDIRFLLCLPCPECIVLE